jgi:hypothetical protein
MNGLLTYSQASSSTPDALDLLGSAFDFIVDRVEVEDLFDLIIGLIETL